MYVHAYQSYVWNAIVSERIRLHGAEKPVVGDLVFEKDPENEGGEPVEQDVEETKEGEVAQEAEAASTDAPVEPTETTAADGAGTSRNYLPPC